MRQYRPPPDPTRAVVRPTTQPPPFPAQETTRSIPADRPGSRLLHPIHTHTAFVNTNGEGTTDVVASHYHRVRQGRILPDESDGHTHRLSGLPSGAGAPTPYPR